MAAQSLPSSWQPSPPKRVRKPPTEAILESEAETKLLIPGYNPISMPTALLAHHSLTFRKMTTPTRLFPQPPSLITLDETPLRVLEIANRWMWSADFAPAPFNAPTLRALLAVWIFADKYFIYGLADAALDQMHALIAGGAAFTARDVRDTWEKTNEVSSLRAFMCEAFAAASKWAIGVLKHSSYPTLSHDSDEPEYSDTDTLMNDELALPHFTFGDLDDPKATYNDSREDDPWLPEEFLIALCLRLTIGGRPCLDEWATLDLEAFHFDIEEGDAVGEISKHDTWKGGPRDDDKAVDEDGNIKTKDVKTGDNETGNNETGNDEMRVDDHSFGDSNTGAGWIVAAGQVV